MIMLYHYKAADGVWRDRCAKHVKTSGPYRAVTPLVPSHCRICVECDWSTPPEDHDHDTSQLERIDQEAEE